MCLYYLIVIKGHMCGLQSEMNLAIVLCSLHLHYQDKGCIEKPCYTNPFEDKWFAWFWVLSLTFGVKFGGEKICWHRLASISDMKRNKANLIWKPIHVLTCSEICGNKRTMATTITTPSWASRLQKRLVLWCQFPALVCWNIRQSFCMKPETQYKKTKDQNLGTGVKFP